MSSLPINDDHKKLDSSMNIIQDEQNNAEPGQDYPPTVRKESTSKERTSRFEKCIDDKSNRYEERRENVQTQNNKRKHSSRSEVYIDKSNEHGSNVLENSNKKRNIERKPTFHSEKFNQSNLHGNSVSSANQTRDNTRDQVKNTIPPNDDVFLADNLNNIVHDVQNNMQPGPSIVRDQVKSPIARDDDIVIIVGSSKKIFQDGNDYMKPGPSTVRNFTDQSEHGERITIKQQTTDNKSEAVEDSVAGLDSIDINDCGMNPQLSHPQIISTYQILRVRTIIDRTSPSSRRNYHSQRRHTSISPDHRSYYFALYSGDLSSSRRPSRDYRSFATSYYTSYFNRRSREKFSSRNTRSSPSTSYAYYRSRSRYSSPYHREGRDRSYRYEGNNNSYPSDLRYYNNSSRDRSPTPYRHYIKQSPRKHCYPPIQRYQQYYSQTKYSQLDLRKTKQLNSKNTNGDNDKNSMLPDQQQHTIQHFQSSAPFEQLAYQPIISSQTKDLSDVLRQGQNTTLLASSSKNINELSQFQNIVDNASESYTFVRNSRCSNSTKDIYLKPIIPPIYLYNVSNYDAFYKSLSNETSDNFSISHTNDLLKLLLTSNKDFKSVIKFFDKNKIKYRVFKYPIENQLSLVIHYIPTNVPEELIFKELTRLKYEIVSVRRLKNRFFFPLPIVNVLLAKPAIKIFSIDRLLNCDVLIEPRGSSNVTPP